MIKPDTYGQVMGRPILIFCYYKGFCFLVNEICILQELADCTLSAVWAKMFDKNVFKKREEESAETATAAVSTAVQTTTRTTITPTTEPAIPMGRLPAAVDNFGREAIIDRKLHVRAMSSRKSEDAAACTSVQTLLTPAEKDFLCPHTPAAGGGETHRVVVVGVMLSVNDLLSPCARMDVGWAKITRLACSAWCKIRVISLCLYIPIPGNTGGISSG